MSIVYRTIPAAINTNFTNETVQKLATCWSFTSGKGVSKTLRFTDHDQDIVYGGNTYSANIGGSPSSIVINDSGRISSMEFEMKIDDNGMKAEEIRAGVWDRGTVYVFLLEHTAPTNGIVKLLKGFIGNIPTFDDFFCKVEVRSLNQLLMNNILRTITPTCDAEFADSRCGLTKANYTESFTVSAVTNKLTFEVGSLPSFGPSDNYYDYGEVEFTSGDNNGFKGEVKAGGFITDSSGGATVTLSVPVPYTIQVGDTLTMVAGCDKKKSTCQTKFNNYDANGYGFRGFPHIPGFDQMMDIGGR